MRRTIRIEITDTESDQNADRESATLIRDFEMAMGYDMSPAQVVDQIRGWLDKPPVAGIRLPCVEEDTCDHPIQTAESHDRPRLPTRAARHAGAAEWGTREVH